MKRTFAAKSSGGSKQVLSDLLIIATIFACLVAFSSTVSAWETGRFYVAAYASGGSTSFCSVKGKQTTNAFTVTHGDVTEMDQIASFAVLYQPPANWMQVGIVKGWTEKNNTDGSQGHVWVGTTSYYVDHQVGLSYIFTYFDAAGTGENHEYWVYLYSWGTNNIMVALIDNNPKAALAGYFSTSNKCWASGQTESHNTRDQMNSYFFDMKAGSLWNNAVPFTGDSYNETKNPPYHIFPYPPVLTTTWVAQGKGS